MIDTGAFANTLDEPTFKIVQKTARSIQLVKSKEKIYAYGSTSPLPLLGKITTEANTRKKITVATFLIVKGTHGSLLSYQTAAELGLVQMNTEHSANALLTNDDNLTQAQSDLLKTHADVFQGLGKLSHFQATLHIDKSVKPVTQKPRRIPFHLRQKTESELERLEKLGIIEDAIGPTPWVSQLVVRNKPKAPDQVRICVDMRDANKAITREKHPTPTMEELLHELNGAKVFSKLDMNHGYLQLELNP